MARWCRRASRFIQCFQKTCLQLERPAHLRVGAPQHGGSRKGQSIDICSYYTKPKLEALADMHWDQRCLDIVQVGRSLGVEWPTEGTYKNMASLAMLWEDFEAPQFGPVKKHDCYLAFKDKYHACRQAQPIDADAAMLMVIKAFPTVKDYIISHPERYKAAMGLPSNAVLADIETGFPAGNRTALQYAMLDRSYQARKSGKTLWGAAPAPAPAVGGLAAGREVDCRALLGALGDLLPSRALRSETRRRRGLT